jgi:hypothetical protein
MPLEAPVSRTRRPARAVLWWWRPTLVTVGALFEQGHRGLLEGDGDGRWTIDRTEI